MNQGKIPTIIGIIILLIGIGLGVYFVRFKNIFKLGAEADVYPQDVRISNITDSSFSVSWTTAKEAAGFISWGEAENKMDLVEQDELAGEGLTHYVTVRGLKESTTYYFTINSAGTDYDNNGAAWQVTSGRSLADPPLTNNISGIILGKNGKPAASALVSVTIGSASALSTTTSENGSWIINLALLRNNDLNSYYLISPTSDVIEISATQGPEGTTSAQIYLPSANPVPPMSLGQTHNFKNTPANQTAELPEITLELPPESTQESKFKIDTSQTAPPATAVTIENIDDGEVISSNKPQFFGDGPAGQTITIVVESDPITGSVKVSSSGTWSWTPPANLTPGTHKITVSFRNAQGILQTISRTFIVQAAEIPAFEATPSATPTRAPTSSPSTPTPTPRISPTPTASTAASVPSATPTTSGSPRPSATVRPTATATAVPIPESGSGYPSLIFLLVGAFLLSAGIGLGGYLLFNRNLN